MPSTPSSIATGAMAGASRALPMYQQISELLTREINAGRWPDGQRLPTEAALAQQLGVAVGTLRKALAELQARGLLQRRQGSGTYVRRDGADSAEASVYGLFRLELCDGSAGLPTARVLSLQRLAHPRAVPRFGTAEPSAVKPAPGAAAGPTQRPACYRVRRLRLLNQQPVALEEIWFGSRLADQRLGRPLTVADLHDALYLFYRQALGFWIAQVEDQVGAGPVPAWAPPGFAPAAGCTVPRVQRRSWSQAGLLEEFSHTWFDADRARYVARWR